MGYFLISAHVNFRRKCCVYLLKNSCALRMRSTLEGRGWRVETGDWREKKSIAFLSNGY